MSRPGFQSGHGTMQDPWDNAIAGMIGSGRMCAVACTAGGWAVSKLLATSGVSKFLADVRVPYSTDSMFELLGMLPDQACSAETALAMACVSFHRAARLGGDRETAIGIGATAALASSRPKRGEHRCFAAAQTCRETRLLEIVFEKGARNRADEDRLVGETMLHAISASIGIEPPRINVSPADQLKMQSESCPPEVHGVWSKTTPGIWQLPGGEFQPSITGMPAGILCGAFNPRHIGHDQLRSAAERSLNGPVFFEMTINNAEKPPLDFISLSQRCKQFRDIPLLLTAAPTFAERVDLLPGVVFVVGIDTAVRIVEPKFYGGTDGMRVALNGIRDAGCRFLVAGRIDGETFRTLSATSIATEFSDLFAELPERDFREDISSTQLRESQ